MQPPSSQKKAAKPLPGDLLERHVQAFWYVLTVVLPIILRTGRKPVIFWKYSGIGDIICTIPAALELKKRHPGVPIIYNCFQDYACVPRMGGITDIITSLRHIGVVTYWYQFLLAGSYCFASEDDMPVDHTGNYIKGFGIPFGIDIDGSHPRLHIRPEILDRVKSLLKNHGITPGAAPLVILHPGPTLPVREWSGESWAALVHELQERGCASIVQLGTGVVMRFGEVKTLSLPGVTSLVNELTLEESIALISLGNLFVGVDSGLLHAAASMGVPSVGIWGATSPQFRYSQEESRSFVISNVECQGCHHRLPVLHWDTGCPYDIRCMKAISVDEVLQACLNNLEQFKNHENTTIQ